MDFAPSERVAKLPGGGQRGGAGGQNPQSGEHIGRDLQGERRIGEAMDLIQNHRGLLRQTAEEPFGVRQAARR